MRIIELNAEFDPIKARANHRKHGVGFVEAVHALQDDFAVSIEDPDAIEEHRFVTLCMDRLGRVLVVVHTQRGDMTRIISARKASRREATQYHAR
jgi:uncharacterized protein